MSKERDRRFREIVRKGQQKALEIAKEEGEYTPFSVILGRDLIFMDWTVQFGSQIVGILIGGILGFIFGAGVFALFTGSTDAKAYLIFQIGIILAAIGLCVYYINRLGIQINSPRQIAGKKSNILKIGFFGLTFAFGIAYIYNNHLAPAVFKVAGTLAQIDVTFLGMEWLEENFGRPVIGGSLKGGGTGGNVGTIDFNTTNQYIMLLLVIVLVTAIFALLYAGIMYSMNIKVRTMQGVAIGTSTILLGFFLLSQYSFTEYLFKAFETQSYSLILIFLSDSLYYFSIALITILVYHQSRRIELSIIVLFIGFIFGYGAPSNVVLQIIALKWGFPNYADNLVTTADILSRTVESLQYIGLFGLIIYPIIFYRDTVKFFVKAGRTIGKQGLPLIIFSFVVLAIEVLVLFISQYLGIFLFLIVFLILVGVGNSLISKRYGKQSYTALLTAMSQATLQMDESIILSLEKQTKLLEKRTKRRQIEISIASIAIPLATYFLIMYVTTAITEQTMIGETIFLYTAVPLSLGIIAFSLSFYFIRNPMIKRYFNYPIKAVGTIGAIIYTIYAFYGLVYNTVGYYPLLSLFYIPLIYLPIRARRKTGTLLLSIAGENKQKAIDELLLREDLDLMKFQENLDFSPPIFKNLLTLILTKRGEKEIITKNLHTMLRSNFPIERSTAALCLLYINDSESVDDIIRILEMDVDPKVRNAIAYGLRYYEKIPVELYKRVIDSQHYEDDSNVLETLKQSISRLDQQFTSYKEDAVLEELGEEELREI